MGMISFKKIDVQKLPVQKLLIVALAIIAIFSIRSCRLKEIALNDKGLEIDFYQNQNQTITREKNKFGEEIASQKILLVTKDKALEKQLLANSSLTSINSHYKAKLKTTLTNVTAGYIRDTVFEQVMSAKEAHENLPDSVKVIPVGTKFIKEDKWFSIKGRVQEDGIKFDSLSFINEPTINIGYKRKEGIRGYFQKKDKTIEIINPNPYTTTTGISNINFKEPPKMFFETRGFAFGVGVLATVFAGFMLSK